jgi:hypothetical protein
LIAKGEITWFLVQVFFPTLPPIKDRLLSTPFQRGERGEKTPTPRGAGKRAKALTIRAAGY